MLTVNICVVNDRPLLEAAVRSDCDKGETCVCESRVRTETHAGHFTIVRALHCRVEGISANTAPTSLKTCLNLCVEQGSVVIFVYGIDRSWRG